jgi:hypothetical protein
MEMVRPAIENLDEQVKNTRKSQLYLATHIEQLSTSWDGKTNIFLMVYSF